MMIVAGVTLLVAEPTVATMRDRCEQPYDTACTVAAPELAHTHDREPVWAITERAAAAVNSGAPTGPVPPFVNKPALVFDHHASRWQPSGSRLLDMPLTLRALLDAGADRQLLPDLA